MKHSELFKMLQIQIIHYFRRTKTWNKQNGAKTTYQPQTCKLCSKFTNNLDRIASSKHASIFKFVWVQYMPLTLSNFWKNPSTYECQPVQKKPRFMWCTEKKPGKIIHLHFLTSTQFSYYTKLLENEFQALHRPIMFSSNISYVYIHI